MSSPSSSSFINDLSIRAKVNLAVGGIFTLLLVIVTTYEVQHEDMRLMDMAKYEVEEAAGFYFDSLNTMMLTNSMDQRHILRSKMLARPEITEARIIRGQAVTDQFGPGHENETALDELDRKALQGEKSVKILESANGRVITAVLPFRATENTRGVNCLKCHSVPSGTVNGAVRISRSLEGVEAAVQRELWTTLGMNLIFFVIGLVLINILLKSWLITPLLKVSSVVKKRAEGDTLVRADASAKDEIGCLANAFNHMADNVNTMNEREHEATETLRHQVDHLLDVVNQVAEGNYSVNIKLDANEGDAIVELAESLQIMITYIGTSAETKREEVEALERKVDAILHVVTLAEQGDLTGEVNLEGDDAIGKLGQGVQNMVKSLNALVAQVQRSGIQVTSSATEIAATAKQQEATIAEQAETTNKIAATATEISATAKELENTIDEVAGIAERTTESAASGQQELSKMGSTMQQIEEAAASIAAKFEVLNEKARNIDSVKETINKVADQTNLLSLNAAIEAEKAGEYGRGFSVVANEVRRLADQTAVATLDIEQMVKEMQSAVSSGVLSMDKFTAQVRRSSEDVNQVSSELTQIIDEVQELTPRFESVQEGMHFQSQGAEQIKTAMMQLSESAQQTVETLRHSSGAIDQLNDAAQTMQSSVSKLRVKRS